MDSNNANVFEAKGRGYFNQLPHRIVPTERNATAMFINKMIVDDASPWKQRPLWITAINTGYNLSVNYGQGPQGRTTYPHNLQQTNIVLTGITPNQYEYDKIVEFATRANHNLLNFKDPGGLQNGIPAIELRLYSYFYGQKSWALSADQHTQQRTQEYEGWLYDVAIENIEAGHERTKFAREYQISCIVINDHLQDRTAVSDDVFDALYRDYIQGLLPFGLAGVIKPPTTITPPTATDEQTVTRPDASSEIWGRLDPTNPIPPFPNFPGV
jgi:hypothetical protein